MTTDGRSITHNRRDELIEAANAACWDDTSLWDTPSGRALEIAVGAVLSELGITVTEEAA